MLCTYGEARQRNCLFNLLQSANGSNLNRLASVNRAGGYWSPHNSSLRVHATRRDVHPSARLPTLHVVSEAHFSWIAPRGVPSRLPGICSTSVCAFVHFKHPSSTSLYLLPYPHFYERHFSTLSWPQRTLFSSTAQYFHPSIQPSRQTSPLLCMLPAAPRHYSFCSWAVL